MNRKVILLVLIILLFFVTGCESKKEKKANSGVEVIKSIESIDQQLNCSKDITEQLALSTGNIRLVNYIEMSFSVDKLQEYSIIYDVTFGDEYNTDDVMNVVGRLEENFLSLYNLENGKVVISTKEVSPKRYNIKTKIEYISLTNEEKEKINMVDIGIYDTNLRALESAGFICQTSI